MASSTHKSTAAARETIADGIHEMGSAVRGLASESVGALRDRANEYVDQGYRQIRTLEENLESRIQEQPVKSLLIGVGIGFLLGMILRRR